MADPYTDVGAAQAFTAEHRYRHGSSSRPKVEPELIFRAHRGERAGQPRCWGETSERQWVTHWSQCDSIGRQRLADGSTWCGVHSPKAVERRREAAAAKEAARIAAAQRRGAMWAEEARKHRAYPQLVQALAEIAAGHNDAQTRAREALETTGEIGLDARSRPR